MKTLLFLIIISLSIFFWPNLYSNSKVKMSIKSTMKAIKNDTPLPSFFISHGGPNFMYTSPGKTGSEGAYSTLKQLGKKIVNIYKPDYIVVVSAHWQSSGTDLIEISIPNQPNDENNLIYDFYNFPKYMYQEQFKSKTSLSIANQIKQLLTENGFKSQLTRRGIDHGVWVPFKVCFSNYTHNSGIQLKDGELDIDIPIIQISLTSNEKDFAKHYQLGQVLNFLRSNNIYDHQHGKFLKSLILTSGMSVHNLNDLRVAMTLSKPIDYVQPFNDLLTETLTNTQVGRLEGLQNLLSNHSKLLYSAHPTLEHFVPIVVSLGIVDANDEPIKELYNASELSLGWGIYQFGEDKINRNQSL